MNWQKLPNRILLKNGIDRFKPLGEIYNADIAELGYHQYEIYVRDSNIDMISFNSKSKIIGYFKMFTNELIAIHREDDLIMSDTEINEFISNLYRLREDEEEDLIREGIDNQGISQSYIESICGSKAHNDTISNGKYIFRFKNGFLSNYSHKDGLSAVARDYFDIDAYIQEAKNWYNGDMSRIINEINLHAECFSHTDLNIIRSSVIKKKFSYSNGWCNWIAMAAHYKTYHISFEDILNSTHGNYTVIENNSLLTKIKAYGEIFTQIKESDDVPVLNSLVENNSSFGYIYVMVNPSLPNLVKIGKTTREPNERAKELSSATGVPTPFILVYYKPFKDCHFAELVIHNYLKEKGVQVNDNREFFKVSTTYAIDIINLYFKIEQEKI